MRIDYVSGDATRPIGDGKRIIAHVCNDIGAWGAGFVLAISRRWKAPENSYRALGRSGKYQLGTVEFVRVEDNIWVANMIAQHGIRARDDIPPIRYEALEECLTQVASQASTLNASIHMPRIGCGLAGGSWDKVEEIVSRALADIPVTVYDFRP